MSGSKQGKPLIISGVSKKAPPQHLNGEKSRIIHRNNKQSCVDRDTAYTISFDFFFGGIHKEVTGRSYIFFAEI